jgi:omega-6 fatty acid desaturase (delta-12 desaturase)
VGWITGVLTLTPFAQWRHGHALHHHRPTSIAAEARHVGPLTVRGTLALTRRRVKYHVARNPGVLFGSGPLYFMVDKRIPPKGTRPEHVGRSGGPPMSLAALMWGVAGVGWKAVS